MRSRLFKVVALLCALSVLAAMVIHAGCSTKPAPISANPEVTGSAAQPSASAPTAVAPAPPASAGPSAASAATESAVSLKALEESQGSSVHMGASKSGAMFRGGDLRGVGSARAAGSIEAGVARPQANPKSPAPVSAGNAR